MSWGSFALFADQGFRLSGYFRDTYSLDDHIAVQWHGVLHLQAHRLVDPAQDPLFAQKWVPRPPNATVIAFYCEEYGQTWWPNWGPWSIAKGLGGSEEAVVHTIRSLSSQFGNSYHIEVYSDPLPHNIGYSNGAHWYPASWYDNRARPVDVFIAWRYPISTALAHGSKANYIWLHDAIEADEIIRPWTAGAVSSVMTVSAYQASLLPAHIHAAHKSDIIPYGLDPNEGFVDGPNHAHRFIYASSPVRGLEQVLEEWPLIYSALGGNATLTVLYGFSPAVVRSVERDKGPVAAAVWMDKMRTLLNQDGVQYVGMVNHSALAHAYAQAGFILYPTSYPETGCFALMKAMAMGAIPITSRFNGSVVAELTHEFDLGPPAREGVISHDPHWLREWTQAVISAARADQSEHRLRMKAAARQKFNWDRSARLWHAAIQRDLAGSPLKDPEAALRDATPEAWKRAIRAAVRTT